MALVCGEGHHGSVQRALPEVSAVQIVDRLLDKFAICGHSRQNDAQKGAREWGDFVEAVQEFGEFARHEPQRRDFGRSQGPGDAGYEKIIDKVDRAIPHQLWRGVAIECQQQPAR